MPWYAVTPISAKAVTLENLSAYAAERAKTLASGRSVQPRILIPEGSEDNIAPVIHAFSQQSGINVVAEQISLEDMNTHLILRAFAEDRPYDIALPATFGMPDLVNARAIRPLTDFARLYEPGVGAYFFHIACYVEHEPKLVKTTHANAPIIITMFGSYVAHVALVIVALYGRGVDDKVGVFE